MGSLNQLMEMTDSLSKLDGQIDQSVKRTKKVYSDMCKEIDGREDTIAIETGNAKTRQ